MSKPMIGTTRCKEHGQRRAGFVCPHLTKKGPSRGFLESRESGHMPTASCLQCEPGVGEVQVVCEICYVELREHHGGGS